jgi:glycosidase
MIDSDGWNALYLENHDQGRSVSRFGSPQFRAVSAKMLATFLALQSGTPFVFQGQELAQPNMPESWGPDRFRDIEVLNHWKAKEPLIRGDEEAIERQMKQYRLKSRDNARTPMQWDRSSNAGFTEGAPWMDVHEDYEEWNAEAQVQDEESTYWYWARTLKLRKEKVDLFVYGDFGLVAEGHGSVFAYKRMFKGEMALVVCNFTGDEVEFVVPEEYKGVLEGKVLLNNYRGGAQVARGEGRVRLRPFEAVVFASDV